MAGLDTLRRLRESLLPRDRPDQSKSGSNQFRHGSLRQRSPLTTVRVAQAAELRHPLKSFRLALKARAGSWPSSRTQIEFSDRENDSEGESESDCQHSLVRQFGRQVKRVELIVLVGEVQQPDGEFRVPSPK